ncbi:LuxR family transcriptional regulator [Kutzneria viridogrisea]|uniref:DNA-binding CsgD family transcriptional regulator n=1 Tax=Kutzneria viridogrisea TaxID=47990 RepID=A0ABR6BY69_9PSEU|nr:DNA-binding CsgD family transcriptional regulator [Kutzneria viridogrisea]
MVTPPLRGRAAELDLVLRVLRAGSAAVLVVRGEPGIGKTALVDAAAEQAARMGYRTGSAAAHEADNVTPLASLGPALRLGPDPLISSAEFLALAPLAEQPLWLAEQLAALLEVRARDQPVLLSLDDVQWADPLSAFVLRMLPIRLAAAPIVWLLASREQPGGPVDQIAQVAERGVPVHRTTLGPLAEDAALDIAADRLGHGADPALARQLIAAGGVPFLVVQLVDGLLNPGEDLLDGVRRRVAATSESCRALLRQGAVLGARFRLEDAAALGGQDPARLADPLREAIDSGLLRDEGTAIAFRHDLLRQAVYGDIPPSARRAAHRAVAEYLLAAGRPAAEAAPHVSATATPGDAFAVDVLRRAAHEVLDTMSITSMDLIRQAFDLLTPQDPRWPEVGEEVVAILLAARQFAEAEKFADHLLQGPLDPGTTARVHLRLAPRLWLTGRHQDLLRHAADIPGADPELATRLAAYRAHGGGEVPAAADPVVLAVRGERAETAGEFAAAAHWYAQARAAATGQVGAPDRGHLELREVLVGAYLGDTDRLGAVLDAGAAESWLAPQVGWLRAHLHLVRGRLTQAAEEAARALRLMDDLHDEVARAHVLLVLVVTGLLRGDHAAARQYAGEIPVLQALLADSPADLVALAASTPWREEILVHALCSARRSGGDEAAAGPLAELAARNPGVAVFEATRALALGEHSRAVDLLATADRPLLLAQVREDFGRATLGGADREAAIEALDAAWDAYTEMGAVASAARVQRLLQGAGVRRRRWAPAPSRPETGWAALTEMERTVALLIADGHTNRSAAQELTLSPSTINTHLRAVFTKLGVNSRVQLAKLVLQRPD